MAEVVRNAVIKSGGAAASDPQGFVLEELSQHEIAELFSPFDERDQLVEDVDGFIEEQKKRNTVKSTQRDLKNVQRWLFLNKKETRQIEFIPPNHLNDFLAELFISIRKENGLDYEPSSLETMKNSIDRYLREKNYPKSLKDREFEKCLRALQAKKVQLKKNGLGRKPQKCFEIDQNEEDQLFESNAFGSKTPQALQKTLFYYLGKMFGFRARDEARQLQFGDVVLKLTSDGQKYLEFHERSTKTRDGSNLHNCRETTPKIFSMTTNSERYDTFFT